MIITFYSSVSKDLNGKIVEETTKKKRLSPLQVSEFLILTGIIATSPE